MSDIAALVADNLEIWTTAFERKGGSGRGSPKKVNLYGVERLRALILELALRGKLVPQDPADEPAAKLLPKMAKERERRINAKEIKKAKLPVSVDTEPFALPPGWTWIPMGQTGNIFTGNSVNSKVRSELESNAMGRPYVATKDIGYGLDPIVYENGLLTAENDRRFVVAKPSTVFICAEGGSAGRKIAISDREITFGNKLIANETWSSIEPRFVLFTYLSDFFFAQFSGQMTGIIGGISRAKFLALPFPLAPLEEQRRIVAKVDELMALCNSLEQESEDALTAHQTLVETLLASLTTSMDAADLASNWARLEKHFDTLFITEASVESLEATLVELALDGSLTSAAPFAFAKRRLSTVLEFGPKNGYSPRSVEHDTGTKSLSLSATTRGEFDGSHTKNVDTEPPAPNSELWLKTGDVLVQRANSIEHVGVAALYDGPDNQFIYPDLMMKLRFSEEIDPRFAVMCLNSKSVREYLRSKASGTSGSMPKINQGTLRGAEFPVPDMVEQRRIIAKVDELMSLCSSLKSQLAVASETQRHLADAITNEAAA